MDIGFLDTTTASEQGKEFEILNPKTGEKTHFFVTILGPDCKRYAQITKDVMAEYAKEKDKTVNDIQKEIVIRSVLGFRAEKPKGKEWEDDEVVLNGEALKFSEPNVRKVMDLMPTVWAQLAEIQKNRGNFLKQPATD